MTRQIFLSFLLIGLTSFEVHGSSTVSIEASLQNDHQKLTQEHQALLDAEVQRRGILGALFDVNKELNHLSSDVDSLQTQVDQHQRGVESYSRVIVRIERIRDHAKELLKSRLRALYKIGFRGYAEILLSSQSGSDFSRNMKFLKIITEKDGALISNYKKSLDLLVVQQGKLRHQVRIYLEFQKRLKAQQELYAEEKRKQLQLLTSINQDRDTHLQALKEIREAGLKLEEKLVQLGVARDVSSDFGRALFVESKGQLKVPVNSPVLQKYGIVTNEKFKTKIFHKGIFFAAQPKDPVAAVFWGKVAYSGWIDGYGETLIIDHGDHYYSLYAHNAKLIKQIGDSVSRGEIIALAGDTASLRGPGLYMEIRHFSESLDPLPWLDLSKPSRVE